MEGVEMCSLSAHVNFKFSEKNHDDLVLAIAHYLGQSEKKPTNHKTSLTRDKILASMNIRQASANEIGPHWVPLRSIEVLGLEDYGSRHKSSA
jgi:hypothetical protein